MPYVARDMADWPASVSQLAENYAAELRITSPSAAGDGLEELFPLYTEPPATFALSRQGETLLARREKHRGESAAGWNPFWPVARGRACGAATAPRGLPLFQLVHVWLPLRFHLPLLCLAAAVYIYRTCVQESN